MDKVFAGSGVYAHVSGRAWKHRRWGHLDDMRPVRAVTVDSCRGFCSFLGPLHTVQRAEFWEGYPCLAGLGCSPLGCGGVDNLNVAWHVGRLLDGIEGDLLFGAGKCL